MNAILDALTRPLVPGEPDDTFRLGIVLNGTVAAGAWTAGALDALIEVLDAWEAAKAAGQPVPGHRLRVEVLGGASGGGVCAAIFARAVSQSFPHVRGEGQGSAANPFWSVWVEALELAEMLDTGDGAGQSLLSGLAIETAMSRILGWGIGTPGVSPLAGPRPWLADPFHVLMTLTNLRGVPFRVKFPDSSGTPRATHFLQHADHAAFAVALRNRPADALVRGDEAVLMPQFADASASWESFAQYVRATGAFPVGFPAVRLSRRLSDYDWRGVVLPAGPAVNGQADAARVVQLVPAWSSLKPEDQPGQTYDFFAVDGGATNNQPMEMVRHGMVGLGKSLPRDPLKARAAVLVLDPFAAGGSLPKPAATLGLLDNLAGLAGAWKNQARFSTADLLLALDETVASRYLLTAQRQRANGQELHGSDALATAGMGAFLGFVERRYRVHDYLLGRRNMFNFLLHDFALPAANPVFGGAGGAGPRPIVPLMPALGGAPAQPAWPMLDPDGLGLEGPIAQRLTAVAGKLADLVDLPCSGLVARGVGNWGGQYASDLLRKGVEERNALA